MKLTHIYESALTIASLIGVTSANADKIIFTGPEVATIPLAKPSLSDLNLDVLSPDNWSLRTNLTRKFPQKWHDASGGYASWLILDHLTEAQRYELRVCWSATEPTNFDLEVFELGHVFQTPELLVSLAEYSQARQPTEETEGQPSIYKRSKETGERKASLLLLRVLAAADYFTDDKALMKNPPPVLVNLHLDPYLLNVLPRSLVPTVFYVIIVGAVSILLARFAAKRLQLFAMSDDNKKKQ